MSTLEAGTAQQHELEILPPPKTPFRFTTKWAVDTFLTVCFWGAVFLFAIGVSVAYTMVAVSFARHVLSYYYLWEAIPSDAETKNGYIIAGLVAGILAGVFICPLFRIWVGLVFDEEKKEVHWGSGRVSSKRLVYWCLLAGAVILSWIFVVISGAVMHRTFYYVTPLSMLGLYAFGTLLAAPSVVFLVFLLKG
ncbi:hypothetical protein DL96DRAFT_1625297 [Flagelloscypha sp. PMI_526]|nr:hypothetical protein DL96DRAFT_1625297 [Flagelloscypha sp. PMI_526]